MGQVGSPLTSLIRAFFTAFFVHNAGMMANSGSQSFPVAT